MQDNLDLDQLRLEGLALHNRLKNAPFYFLVPMIVLALLMVPLLMNLPKNPPENPPPSWMGMALVTGFVIFLVGTFISIQIPAFRVNWAILKRTNQESLLSKPLSSKRLQMQVLRVVGLPAVFMLGFNALAYLGSLLPRNMGMLFALWPLVIIWGIYWIIRRMQRVTNPPAYNRAVQAGDFNLAQEELNQLRKKSPNALNLQLFQAFLLLEWGKLGDAMTQQDSLIQYCIDHNEVNGLWIQWHNRGVALSYSGQFSQAFPYAEAVIRSQPHQFLGYLTLARLYLRMKAQPQRVGKLLNIAKELMILDPVTEMNLSILRLYAEVLISKTGSTVQSIQDLGAKIPPLGLKDALLESEFYFWLGHTADEAGEQTLARTYFQKAYDINSQGYIGQVAKKYLGA